MSVPNDPFTSLIMDYLLRMLTRPHVQDVLNDFFALEESGRACIHDEVGTGWLAHQKKSWPVRVWQHCVST